MQHIENNAVRRAQDASWQFASLNFKETFKNFV